jgi:outer membrane receptor protein involved in Fe transport
MKFTLRSASGAAILAGLAGTFPAWAQEAPQTVLTSQVSGPQQAAPAAVDQTKPAAGPQAAEPVEKVVVTGSLIAGSSESAALPVEVFTTEALEEKGQPSALEFAKELPISGPTQGEANFQGGSAPGAVSFNLRGIGSDKSLTLLNGRRVSEVTSFIPAAALARTEILKDGAAVTYGADAIGGVVNFITRDHFTGLEVKANYKFVDGSDGDYNASILGGIGKGDTNFLWSLEYDHRSELSPDKRDWAELPYNINPAPWSGLSNLGVYTPRGAQPSGPFTPTGAGGTQFTLANEYGPALGSGIADNANAIGTRQQNCEAIGGAWTTSCQFGYFPFYNLVENQDIYRAYGQLNTAVTDDMNFHFDVAYGQVESATAVSPSLPSSRGPALNISEAQFFVPVANPFVAQFQAEHPAPAGTTGYTLASAGTFYRTFAFQGTNAFGDDTSHNEYDSQVWRASASLNGRLGDWAGIFKDVHYDTALTYNQSITRLTGPDLLGFRVQQALNGFGGPNCNATDLDPNRFGTQNPAAAGKNGCLWFNPFATSFTSNPALHLTNPQSGSVRGLPVPAGVASWENSQELQRWLFDKRETESINSSLTLDIVFSGETGIKLPGGDVGWAAGFQARELENRDVVNSPYHNGQTPCPWPGQDPAQPGSAGYTGCTPDAPGPFVFFAPDPPQQQDQQQHSFFGELQIPVFDSLDLSAAVRREDFSGDLGATVYKVSGKWNIWGPLSVRGSYGTNYQAPPIGLQPGRITNGVVNYALAGNHWLPSITQTRSDVVPATAKAWNAGAIWQSRGFGSGHTFRFTLDYFNIKTENEFRQLATTNQILAAVYSTTDAYTNCNHPLAARVKYIDTATSPGGVCAATTNLTTDLASVSTEYGNGPGVETNGIDYQIDYTLPIGPGEFSIGATATQVLKLQDSPATLDGFQVTAGDDRLGSLNFNGAGVAAPEWSVNSYATYRMEKHTFRLGADWRSAVVDDRPGLQYEEDGEDPIYFNFYYLFDLTDTLRLSASVENIMDRDPPKGQIEYGYDARLGSALGRTVQVGIKKSF